MKLLRYLLLFTVFIHSYNRLIAESYKDFQYNIPYDDDLLYCNTKEDSTFRILHSDYILDLHIGTNGEVRTSKRDYLLNEFITQEQYGNNLELQTSVYHELPNGKKLITVDGGGFVFEFRNDSLFRVDKSFFWRSFYGSIDFQYENQLIKYGGYGYFQKSPFFIFYDSLTSGWEVFDIGFQEMSPTPRVGSVFHFQDDKMYLFSGVGFDHEYSPVHTNRKNDVWVFSFEESKWSYLGNSDFNGSAMKFLFSTESYASLLYDYQLLRIDFYNNEFSILSSSNLLNSIMSGLNRRRSFFKPKMGLIPILSYTGEDNLARLTLANIAKELEVGTVSQEGGFYTKPINFKYYHLIFAVALLGLPFLLWYIASNGQLKVQSINGNSTYGNKILYYKGSSEQTLLKLLAERDFIKSYEIHEILRKENESIDTLKKRKSDLISSMNTRFKVQSKTNIELVIESSSDFDKRMKLYCINPLVLKKR